MRLAGWFRLWIVVSLLWWATGAWWLVETHQPNYLVEVATDTSGTPLISPVAKASRQAARDRLDALLAEPVPADPETDDAIRKALHAVKIRGHEQQLAFAQSAAVAPFTDADYVRISSPDWSEWTFRLFAVILAPFVGWLVFLIIRHLARWIWRGFRPATPKANSK